jgi:threonyl-tRNA synthetase
MLHRTILGSIERFLGILIEHYAGAFPFWIAPVQVKILAVGEDHVDYAKDLKALLQDREYRVELDCRDEKLGRKIRDAQMEKVPFMLVVGDRELETDTVSVRDRSEGDKGSMSKEDLLELLKGQFSPL